MSDQLTEVQIRKRIHTLEERLSRLRPIWQMHHRKLFRSTDGIYVIKGNDDDGKVFYFAITGEGVARDLLGGKIGMGQYYIILSCFQNANLHHMSHAVGRWYTSTRRR